MIWPIYKKDLLVLGNPESSEAICTLWTQRKKIAEAIGDSTLYCAIGNLYSAQRGIDPLVRNLLANPQIRHLFVCGDDLSGSGQALIDFFEKGVVLSQDGAYWQVAGESEGRIDLEVSKEAIEALRQGVKIFDYRRFPYKDAAYQIKLVVSFNPPLAESSEPWGKPMVFDKQEPQAETFPAEVSAHKVTGKTVAECWLKLLREIMLFGQVSPTHYENPQQELLNLVVVISDEDPDKPFLPDWLPLTQSDLDEYYPKVLTAQVFPGVSYTYGHRMRAYFGRDQIQDVIDKLKQEPDSRSGVVSLWDPQNDHIKGGSPCFNHLWFRLRDGKLYLTVIIRSNDMFAGWPENAFGLRKLQQFVVQEVGSCRLGELTIISESAHLYDDCWDAAQSIISDHWQEVVGPSRQQRDPRGNFVISLENEEIQIEHCSPGGELLQVFQGKNVYELSLKLAPLVSSEEHALYLGAELQKARIALDFGLNYVQDQGLKRK